MVMCILVTVVLLSTLRNINVVFSALLQRPVTSVMTLFMGGAREGLAGAPVPPRNAI